MPRKSIDALTTPGASSAAARTMLRPSESLPAPCVPIFDELQATVSPGHFQAADRHLLEQLAVAVWTARELAAHLEAEGVVIAGTVNQAGRHLRQQQQVIASLSTKLRLTAQSRVTKRGAAAAVEGGKPSISELYDAAMGGH